MDETSHSLLMRAKTPGDSQSWERLVELYTPLLRSWLFRYNVQASDADDLLQEVLLTLSKELPDFDHSGQPGAFRSWLRLTLVHRLKNFWRARDRGPRAGIAEIEQRLEELADAGSAMSVQWNDEHDRHLLGRLLTQAEPHFSPQTWTAFRRVTLDGDAPNQVATDLGISVNAVFIAKSRVLSRLRREAEGLVDSASGF